MSEAQAWLSSKNDVSFETTQQTQKDDFHRKKVQFRTFGRWTGASLSMNRTLNAMHCHRSIVLACFLSISLNSISTMALTAYPKQWLNIEWVSAIVRQSPTHHSLIRYNGTALLPTVRSLNEMSPMASVNAIVLQHTSVWANNVDFIVWSSPLLFRYCFGRDSSGLCHALFAEKCDEHFFFLSPAALS